ncbi:MAG: IMP dehydrogenase [Cyanobacteria bacterium NC_groundwater_1444_Ag_S-0.65um_54_12]|nr:IMP dehydrogenase [Cyanobacteria bacterium NC_groundwater_1444_Ag_S-0.65um_54_12]
MESFDISTFPEGLTFDDVLLLPGYSEILPCEVDLRTKISRNIKLNIPIISAAMDTVTEHAMAISLAKAGGIGIIHRNLEPAVQANEVCLVKAQVVVNEDCTAAALDARGRLLVGAAVGVAGTVERASLLLAAGADVLVIDTAHGHTKNVAEALKELKANFPDSDVVVGNIATASAAEFLLGFGADALKVGIGPGSICTTRVVAGIGVPQISAIRAVAAIARKYEIPVIADGGIQYSGDLTKAIAAGADTVMLGSLLARTRESAGQEVIYGGRPYKVYRGMGSLGALQNESNDRYDKHGQSGSPLVPEGVEGMVPLGGSSAELIYQLLGGLRKGMGYCGLRNVEELKTQARFIRVSRAAVRESHPHDVMITKEAPNYSRQIV